MPYKLLAPNYESRNLRDYPKDFVETTYYETVHVVNGVAICNHPYSVDLLVKKGYKLVKEPEPKVKPKRKRLKVEKP